MRRVGTRSLLGLLIISLSAVAGVGRESEPQVPSAGLQALIQGRGTPLVMLGGGTLGAAEFEHHARLLAGEYRVIRLEMINFERSRTGEPLPEGYSIRTESAAMARAIDRLKIDPAFDLVGHSLGALVALDYALDHPHRIRTLALMEPPAFWVVPPAELRESADLGAMLTLLRELRPDRAPTDDQLVRFRCALGNCVERTPRRGEAFWDDWARRRSALRGLSAVAEHTDDPDRLTTFRRPVLLMTGADTVAFHRRINDLLASHLPNVERVELPGGHSAPSSAPDAFIAALTGFLARHRMN